MKTSAIGYNLIKSYEGCRLNSYKCVPTEKYYTIGYGHYGVTKSLLITQQQAEEYLELDIQKAEKKVNKYQQKYNFNQNQYDALVSFAFNLGTIDQLTANGTRTKEVIASKILEYNKSSGRILTGLTSRRKAEYYLYNTKMPEQHSIAEVALEVINGEWGNGVARKLRLESCGYSYSEVQREVNKLLQA